jgi:crotonobetainyl-CoA:carnitine CoA-transferase CaiB-like acyl-CoA transferase
MVHDLFRAIGRPDLLDDPRFSTRDGRVGEPRLVEEAVEAWTSERSVDDVIGILEAERVPVAPVRTQKEALNDPRVVERGETRPVTHPELGEIPGIRTSGVPIKFSEDTTGFAFAARGLGDDNDAVYGDLLGYGAERLAELRESGVI